MDSKSEKKLLIEKAGEISLLINDSDTYRDFIEYREIIEKDPDASRLVNRLIELGQLISDNINNGVNSDDETLRELESIKSDFDNNETAREYMERQKAYLELLDKIISRILNPES